MNKQIVNDGIVLYDYTTLNLIHLSSGETVQNLTKHEMKQISKNEEKKQQKAHVTSHCARQKSELKIFKSSKYARNRGEKCDVLNLTETT